MSLPMLFLLFVFVLGLIIVTAGILALGFAFVGWLLGLLFGLPTWEGAIITMAAGAGVIYIAHGILVSFASLLSESAGKRDEEEDREPPAAPSRAR